MIDRRPAPHAFLDETYSDPPNPFYIVSAVLVEAPEVPGVRRANRALSPSGPFHASELQRAGQYGQIEAMLQHVANECSWNIVSVVAARQPWSQEAARQDCLRLLLSELETYKIVRVTADTRIAPTARDPEVHNRKDQRTLKALRADGKVGVQMQLKHLSDSAEPMLWTPDAVSYAHRRHMLNQGSEYWEIVRDVTTVFYA